MAFSTMFLFLIWNIHKLGFVSTVRCPPKVRLGTPYGGVLRTAEDFDIRASDLLIPKYPDRLPCLPSTSRAGALLKNIAADRFDGIQPQTIGRVLSIFAKRLES